MSRRSLLVVLVAAMLTAGGTGFMLLRSTPLVAGVDQVEVDGYGLAEFTTGVNACAEGVAAIAWDCVNQLIVAKAPIYGVTTVLTGLRDAIAQRPDLFEQNCHRNMHYLGEYAGETVGDVDRALALGGPDCQFGFYHGVIEGYARVSPALWEEIDGLCSKISDDPNSYVWGECAHSLGHAVVTRTDDDIDQGLQQCRLLSRNSDVSACATGIFMSWSNHLDRLLSAPGATQAGLDARYHYPPAAERWVMCPDLDDLLAGACVLFFAETVPHDNEHLGSFRRWCDDTFTARTHVRRNCHGGVGRVLGGIEEFRRIGGWPGVIGFCTSGGFAAELIAECAQSSYATATGFLLDAGMADDVCAAWEGHPLRDSQCQVVRDAFAAAAADAGPLSSSSRG